MRSKGAIPAASRDLSDHIARDTEAILYGVFSDPQEPPCVMPEVGGLST